MMKKEDPINTIIVGDALEVLKEFPTDFIHLVITSPPYNVWHEYDGYDDNLEIDAYREFLKNVIAEIYRVLVKGGRLAINIPFAVKNRKTKKVTFLAAMISGICDELNFLDFEFIIWHKGKNRNHFQGNSTAWGSWKSPSNPVFRPLCEAIMIFSKDRARLEGRKEDISIKGGDFKEWTKNIWYIINDRSKKDHPCPFPEELARRLIELYSYIGNIVLDPFNGTGTTTKAADALGRKFIGIDVSEAYCKLARKELSNLNRFV